MSYSRFSDLGFKSDVYVYDDYVFGGVTIHVATERLVEHPDYPYPQWAFEGNWKEKEQDIVEHFMPEYRAFHEHATQEPIESEYAGCMVNVDDKREAIDILLKMRDSGLRVPSIAIEGLDMSIKEEFFDGI